MSEDEDLPPVAPDVDGRGDADAGDPPTSIWRYLGVAGFLLMVLFWVWVFWRANAGVPHPDELDVPASEAAADVQAATPDQRAALNYLQESEAVCAIAQADIAELPFAAGVEDFAERANILDAATQRLDLMVNDLSAVAKPTKDAEAFIAGEWIKDYNQFLNDRRAYANVLRSGEDPPFEISARDGRRVTDYIVNFAEVNEMYSCVPPGDL